MGTIALTSNLELQQRVSSWIPANAELSLFIVVVTAFLWERWRHVRRVACSQLYPSGIGGWALALVVDVILGIVSIAIYYGLGSLWILLFSYLSSALLG